MVLYYPAFTVKIENIFFIKIAYPNTSVFVALLLLFNFGIRHFIYYKAIAKTTCTDRAVPRSVQHSTLNILHLKYRDS